MGARKPFSGFQTITATECCLIKLFPYILFEKCMYILAVEMANPGLYRHTTKSVVCRSCVVSVALVSRASVRPSSCTTPHDTIFR